MSPTHPHLADDGFNPYGSGPDPLSHRAPDPAEETASSPNPDPDPVTALARTIRRLADSSPDGTVTVADLLRAGCSPDDCRRHGAEAAALAARCAHRWDGPSVPLVDEKGRQEGVSATCSQCGAVAYAVSLHGGW